MTFVFSFWYIVMAFLVIGIAGCIAGFILMDQKDKALIKEFVESSNEVEVPAKDSAEQKSE